MTFRQSVNCTGLLVLMLGFGAAAAQAGVVMPECEPLGEWLATVDHTKKWTPIEGERVWVPEAFKEQAFADLFGAPVLDWTRDEAVAVSKHLFACGQQADEAGDRELRTRFYRARGWFKGNLAGVVRIQKRVAQTAEQAEEEAIGQEKRERGKAEQKLQQERRLAQRQQTETKRMEELEAALDAVVNQPDSLRLLESLIVLRETNPRDALGVNSAIGRFGQKAGTLLGYARHLKLKMHEDPIGPALDKRIGELRTTLVADYLRRIDTLTAEEPDALRHLKTWENEVQREFAGVLGEEVTSNLLSRISERRATLEEEVVTALMQRIDEAPAMPKATEGLALVQEGLNRGHKMGLAPERREQLRAHAAQVEAELAENAVREAEAGLADVTEDLAGLRFLLNTIPRVEHPPLAQAPEPVLASYREAARARLNEVAAAAFPEFKNGLTDFSADQQGLHYLDRTVDKDKAFELVSPDIRSDYEEAVAQRRAEIRTTLNKAYDSTRKESVARGGNADLIGQVFQNAETGFEVGFMDEKRAVLGINGKEEIAPYEVDGDQIIIHGTGMRLQFTQRGSGADTTLDWLGKTFTRYER